MTSTVSADRDTDSATLRSSGWWVSAMGTLLTGPLAEHLVMLATRAPSVHNSQPWRLVVTDDDVEVRADFTRRLAVIDPLGRQLLISCGTLVHHLVVAARALRLDTNVTLLPEGAGSELVARVDLHRAEGDPTESDVAQAEAILHRSTIRRRFADTPISAVTIETLRRAAENQGAMLTHVRGDDLISVGVLVEHAERELLSDDQYRQELQSWVFDPVRDGERDDGIPVAAVLGGPARAEELHGRRFVPPPNPEPIEPEPERPTILLISSTGDAPVDWVRSGMALSALLLKAAAAGLVAQPIGQVTDVPAERARLRHDLGLVGVPQLLLRLGAAAEHGGWQTPRRPVESVVTWAESFDQP